VLLTQGPTVRLSDLPRTISGLDRAHGARVRRPAEGGAAFAPDLLDRRLRDARRAVTEAFERAYLVRLLEETGGRVGEAARRAGIHERSLFELMRKHDVHKESFRALAASNRR
jgi:two-component system, NtrC family, response regulator AtoC